ncbi:MAG: iron(III) transport system substrate-binding protein [Alphaproteobacteria bacterium]|nr:iron(III) transport system substrate-binding protein [Alphaproteobacteria bacterium]
MLARWCRGALAAALLMAAASALGQARAAEVYAPDQELVEAARKEGQVLWYTTLIVDQIVRPMIKAFNAQVPGIDVRFVRIDSGQQVARLMNEARVGRVQADVWAVIDGAAPLAQHNVAAEFEIASQKGLPAALADPNRRWIATNLASRSLAYNTTLVAQEQAPKTYQDLLDPRWKGKLVWNPNAMTGAWGFIATVLSHMGEDQGMAYLRKLARQQIVPVPIATRAVLDRVIAGEYPIGLEMVNAHAAISLEKGAPVRWVPLDAVTTTLQVAGVTTGAPHPNAGRLFLDFITSRSGQDLFRAANYIPMHPDIPAKDPWLKAEQGGYKSIVLSPEEVDNNATRYQKIYQDIFR